MNLGLDVEEIKKEASYITSTKVIDKLDKALNAPGRWRHKIIKWIFPEIIDVANELRKYYWFQMK